MVGSIRSSSEQASGPEGRKGAGQAFTPTPWWMDTSLHIYGTAPAKPLAGSAGVTVQDFPHVATAKRWIDAKLITAAPDLFEALTNTHSYLNALAKRLAALNLDNIFTFGLLKSPSLVALECEEALSRAASPESGGA